MTEKVIEGKTQEEWKALLKKWGPIRLKVMIALYSKKVLNRQKGVV